MIKKYYDYNYINGIIHEKVYIINKRNNDYDIIRLTGVDVKPFTMVNDEFIHSTINDVFKTKIHLSKLIKDGEDNLLIWVDRYSKLLVTAKDLNISIDKALSNKRDFSMILKIGKALENCDYWRKELSLRKKHKRKNNLLIVYAIKNRIKGN